ncbi:hypothetical protein MPLB_1820025 [Mesorhizobium sp. ORS 3324]|nr:hypothetical protein MPLB_1820025 [Mesorhizobium sp. ORS 3324]
MRFVPINADVSLDVQTLARGQH